MHLVSVIIPTYNRASLLTETINSVLAQTYPAVEIIVVDDGSADNTAEVVAEYGDRVTYLQQENQGEAVARNYGIQMATGDYLTFLDDDDLIAPSKLEKQVRLLDSRPDIGIVYCRHSLIDESGRCLGQVGLLPEGDILPQLVLSDFIWAGAPLLRRECIEAVGVYDVTLPWQGKYAEDWDMWLRLALAGYQCACVQELLGFYRLTRMGQTAHIDRSEVGNIAMLDKFFLRPNLPPAVVAVKNRVYAARYLWLSSRYYAAQQWAEAQRASTEAFRYQPDLLVAPEEWLQTIEDQALSYRVAQPLAFVRDVFEHLPHQADKFRQEQNRLLGRVQAQIALRLYHEGLVAEAQEQLRQALALAPTLLTEPSTLGKILSHQALHLPVASSFQYVRFVLAHLPEVGLGLANLRPQILSQVSIARAFEAYMAHHYGAALAAAFTAVRYHPALLRKKGVISLIARSFLRLPAKPYSIS